MSKIYVASSWRNEKQPTIVSVLKQHGHDVYDFRNPSWNDVGFHWSEIDPHWRHWTPRRYLEALQHPLAIHGFKTDMDAMKWADVFIGVQPFGKSASLELGWACGQGKKTFLLLDAVFHPSNGEPELMVKMCDHIYTDINQILLQLR